MSNNNKYDKLINIFEENNSELNFHNPKFEIAKSRILATMTKDNNTGVYNLSKTYNYLYDKDGSPIMMETKKYDLNNGNLLSTFKSEIKY